MHTQKRTIIGKSYGLYPFNFIYISSIFLVIFAVLMMAYLGIYGERKLWAAVQLRRGPNIVGPFGLLQPVADFLKLLLKNR